MQSELPSNLRFAPGELPKYHHLSYRAIQEISFRDFKEQQRAKNRGKEPYSVRRVFWADTSAVKEEANSGNLLSLTLAKRIHELLELSGALDLEKDFIVVISDLDVQVLCRRRGRFLVRHDGCLI